MRNLYDPGTFLDENMTESVSEGFFNKRMEYFIAQFRELDLDIICLQEVGGEKGITTIGQALGYNYFFAKPNRRGIRMAVLYKKHLEGNIHCESVSLGELQVPSLKTRGDTESLPLITQRRDVLVVDINFSGKKLRLVTFHLKSLLPEYLEGDDIEKDVDAHADAKFRCIFIKMMEIRALRAFANKSIQEGYNLVFLGDFNENNNSSIIDILKSSNKEDYMLYDVLVGYDGDKTTLIHKGNKLTFDTMLVSKDIKELVENVLVHNSGLKDFSTLIPDGGAEYEFQFVESDHALVSVTLK